MLIMPVFAANKATQIQSSSVVAGDGSCQVSCTVSIDLTEARSDLTFPVPANASGVSVNGSQVRIRKDGSIGYISLKFLSGFTGSYTLNVHYTLPSVVTLRPEEENSGEQAESGRLLLTLPILSGFSMPVESMDFTITLPMDVDAVPTFSSGYHQESIESDMDYSVNGNTISGFMTKDLLDSETLTMTLMVPSEMFTATVSTDENSPIFPLAMAVCSLLAVLYWLIFLRCRPLFRSRVTLPPASISAGEIRSRLVGSGADLTLMVLSWAQLGYLTLVRDRRNRVYLHKRMEMGNERSAFENHCFRKLFGKKRSVEGTGLHYARLFLKIADDRSNTKGQYLTKSGNTTIFRLFGVGIGLFAGAAIGAAIGAALLKNVTWKIVMMVLFGILGALSSWCIQAGCFHWRLRGHLAVTSGLILSILWILISLLTGLSSLALYTIIAQVLIGAAAAYGGRRTGTARQSAEEILGLRKYLKSVSRKDLERILKSNPEFFFDQIPNAMALGVDKNFAKRFGRIKLVSCPDLTCAGTYPSTAAEWILLLGSTTELLDARHKKMKHNPFTNF